MWRGIENELKGPLQKGNSYQGVLSAVYKILKNVFKVNDAKEGRMEPPEYRKQTLM